MLHCRNAAVAADGSDDCGALVCHFGIWMHGRCAVVFPCYCVSLHGCECGCCCY